MDNSVIELVGGPCGHHGPYTFYKAFRYSKNGSQRIISLCEFFFVKLWSDSDLVCIGELQLLWIDKNSEQMLASLRLYFLPENTPEGRMDHGEDEVLAISEKVVLRLEDLLTWITVDTEWTWGKSAVWEREVKSPEPSKEEPSVGIATTLDDNALDFADVEKERVVLVEQESKGPSVIVLSYSRYCRYRSLMKRLEGVEDKWLKNSLVAALGGFTVPNKNTRVLFCRDTFDYPDLEGHELLCNHLAPKLKGRPRGKRKKRSLSPGGSESNESESSVSAFASASIKTRLTTAGGRNGLRCNSTTSPRRSTRSAENIEERDFLNNLHAYMKSHHTPIGRIPSIGYKEIDLHAFFTKVQKVGGYESCTANRMWKPIFDELGGNHNSTSAATITRRHYERLLLSFERHIKGEEYKPLPISERRRLKSKTSSFSDAESTEGDRSSSGKSTPVPSSSILLPVTPTTPVTPTEVKEFSVPEKTKTEGKVSSLRSVRVKPERLRENSQKDKPIQILLPETNTSSLLEKNILNVPVMAAVTPVVENILPETAVSPLEGKDNIPATSITETSSIAQTRIDDDDDEIIEVPYKPKTPEIIDLDLVPDLEPEPEPNSVITNNAMLYDVKKRKLEILKEGGLEVTAIGVDAMKDGRLTVIHPGVIPITPKTELGNLSITVTSDSRRMPPPVPRSQSPKKAMVPNPYLGYPIQISEALIPRRDILNPKFVAAAPIKPIPNGNSPPKVIQSRSIYSYSERTVYGNPKDPFMPPPHTIPVIRNIIRSPTKPSGGEILDLTIKNPQKPVVEIVRVPTVTRPARAPKEHSVKNFLKNSAAGLPLIDGRVGSNLEITLVSAAAKNVQNVPSQNHARQPSYINSRPSLKRSSAGGKPSKNKPDPHYANSRHAMNDYQIHSIPHTKQNGGPGLVVPAPHSIGSARSNYPKSDLIPHSKSQQQQQHQQSVPAQTASSLNPFLYPGYLNQLSAAATANKSMQPPYLPMLDPLYYSALCSQGLYQPGPMAAPPPMFPPVPSVDQLQFYKDLMAHSARGRYPFPPMPQDVNQSITCVGQSNNPNVKK